MGINLQELTVDTLPTPEEIALDALQVAAKLNEEAEASLVQIAHTPQDLLDVLLAKEGGEN